MGNENIKLDFENKIHQIEEKDNNKNKFFVNIMNISFVILFIAVSIGTVLSYYNYVQTINSLNNNKNNTKVVEFGK